MEQQHLQSVGKARTVIRRNPLAGLVVVAVAMSAPTAASSQAPRSAPTSRPAPATAQTASHGVMTMDAAGVTLGMAGRAAKAAAEASSYRCRTEGRAETFDEQVRDEVMKRRGQEVPFFRNQSGVGEMDCTGPNGETLHVGFAQERSGEVVNDFRLQADASRIDQASMQRQVAAKYGRPTFGDAIHGTWCDPGYRCGGVLIFIEGPVVSVDASHGLDVIAMRGRRADAADAAAILAEAARQAPAKPRAAF